MNDQRSLALLGAGGHAKVVLAAAIKAGWHIVGLFDDDSAKRGSRLLGCEVIGGLDDCPEESASVLAVGDNRMRAGLAARDLSWQIVVDPDAVVHPSITIEPGVVIFAGAVLQPDTTIGEHAIVNTSASIDHDCVIGPYAHVAPNTSVAGGVVVGEGAFLGIGSAVTPGVTIGAWAVVGAGAVVTEDVAPGETVVGVPAKPLQRK